MKSIHYFYIFALALLMKISLSIVIYFVGNDFFGGGNDSDYYNAYALRQVDDNANAWATLLRQLNDWGLYSRIATSNFLKFLGFICIPILVGKLIYISSSSIRKRMFWAAIVAVSFYPTLIYYTTDIYRDVFMVFIWLVGLFVFKFLSEKRNPIRKIIIFLVGLLVAYFLFELRPYLGFSYLVALTLSPLYSFRRYPFFISLSGLLLMLFILFYIGFLNPILSYRLAFIEDISGGSNLGITFSSIAGFFPDLILSTMYQLFGIFFVNRASVLVFISESFPFIMLLIYVIKNRKFSNVFIDYIVVFFITYSVIWLLGNDNLGTAVRLRMYNYISIFIAFCIIYQNKKIFLLNKTSQSVL